MSWVSPGRRYFSEMSEMCFHTSTAQALGRPRALLVGFASAQRGDPFQRKLGVDDQRTLVGQEDHAVRPGVVGQRVLEGIERLRQRVLDDGLHARLAEGAARLLVAQHVAQRDDLVRQLGEVLLGVVEHGDALVEALQPRHRLPRGLVHGVADPGRHRVEPLGDDARELGLPSAEPLAERLQPAGGLGLDAGEVGDPGLHRLVEPRLPDGLLEAPARPPRGEDRNGDQQRQHRQREGETGGTQGDVDPGEGEERLVHGESSTRFGALGERSANAGGDMIKGGGTAVDLRNPYIYLYGNRSRKSQANP